MSKKLPLDVKILIVKEAFKGANKSQICKQYQISRTILYRWIKVYKLASKRSKRLCLSSKIRRGTNHHKSLRPATKKRIFTLAIKNPGFSAQKIAKMTGVSSFGAWRYLRSLGISSKD